MEYRTILSVSSIVIALSVFYYLIIFLPKESQIKAANIIETRYRTECWKELADNNSFLDTKIKEGADAKLIQLAVRNFGLTDEKGDWIKDDVWIASCIQRKLNMKL